jgi:hypothetical protein
VILLSCVDFFQLLSVICVTFLPLLGYISQSVKLGTQILPTYRVFSVEELKEATRNFEWSSYIGEGSIGKVLLNDLLFMYNLFLDSRICCHHPR